MTNAKIVWEKIITKQLKNEGGNQANGKVNDDFAAFLLLADSHTPHGGNVVQAAINTKRRCRNGNIK